MVNYHPSNSRNHASKRNSGTTRVFIDDFCSVLNFCSVLQVEQRRDLWFAVSPAGRLQRESFWATAEKWSYSTPGAAALHDSLWLRLGALCYTTVPRSLCSPACKARFAGQTHFRRLPARDYSIVKDPAVAPAWAEPWQAWRPSGTGANSEIL